MNTGLAVSGCGIRNTQFLFLYYNSLFPVYNFSSFFSIPAPKLFNSTPCNQDGKTSKTSRIKFKLEAHISKEQQIALLINLPEYRNETCMQKNKLDKQLEKCQPAYRKTYPHHFHQPLADTGRPPPPIQTDSLEN